MSTTESTRPVTARVQIARVAERVVEEQEGVGATRGAPRRWLTSDGDRTIAGVVVAEGASGAIDLHLHLVVAGVGYPLEQLAAGLRGSILAEATRIGLGERLGAIDVTFHDIGAPDPVEGGA